MKREVARWLNTTFGVPIDFLEHLEIEGVSSGIWVCTPQLKSAPGPIRRRGIKLAIATRKGFKLTSQGAMLLARFCSKRTLKLDREKAVDFVQGKDLANPGLTDGQVIVMWNGFGLGVGLVMGQRIKNQLAAHRRLPPKN